MKRPTEVARERYAGKRVTVVGLAREGTALVRFLAEAGARVTANDRGTPSSLAAATESLKSLPVEFRLGEHPLELFLASDHIFVSPGVPQQLPPLVEARRRGVPISSETQLFFELCGARIIGVTGSSGKTTTTALAGRMLEQAGLPVHVGGNIGIPLLERLDSIRAEDWVLLEMSSFQLETLPYSPHVGALLNVTPNHLDRHGDMESYRAAKINILNYQRPGDWAVLNADDPVTSAVKPRGRAVWFSLEKAVEGSFPRDGWITVRRDGVSTRVCPAASVKLLGRHNLANVLAASAIGLAVGVPAEAMVGAIDGFRAVPHRLELVGELDGVRFYNDSIATAPERSVASLRSFDAPTVLIAGGRDKALPMGEWAREIRRRVKALVLMGESADAIARAVAEPGEGDPPRIVRVAGMDEAVAHARRAASAGDVVLLAPGCTSFDMYRDFEERGNRFREAVAALKSEQVGGAP